MRGGDDWLRCHCVTVSESLLRPLCVTSLLSLTTVSAAPLLQDGRCPRPQLSLGPASARSGSGSDRPPPTRAAASDTRRPRGLGHELHKDESSAPTRLNEYG